MRCSDDIATAQTQRMAVVSGSGRLEQGVDPRRLRNLRRGPWWCRLTARSMRVRVIVSLPIWSIAAAGVSESVFSMVRC